MRGKQSIARWTWVVPIVLLVGAVVLTSIGERTYAQEKKPRTCCSSSAQSIATAVARALASQPLAGRYELRKQEGGDAVVFDSASGRIFVVNNLKSVREVDPVGGVSTRRPMTSTDELGGQVLGGGQ